MAKKPELNELFQWLQQDSYNRFEIYDVNAEKLIVSCASYDDLTKKGAITLESYFADLVNKGIGAVQVTKKRKNGSSFTRASCGFNYGLSTTGSNNNVAASGMPDRPAATPQQSQQPYGLAGAATPYGLGMPEIYDMRSKSDRYDETKEENRELKTELKLIKTERDNLKEENLGYKFGADSKPSGIDKLFEGFAQNPSALAGLLQAIKGTGNTPGLNAAPAHDVNPQLSDLKSTVVDVIIKNEQLTDQQVHLAYFVLQEAANKNEKFLNDYNQILLNHKLIE